MIGVDQITAEGLAQALHWMNRHMLRLDRAVSEGWSTRHRQDLHQAMYAEVMMAYLTDQPFPDWFHHPESASCDHYESSRGA